MTKDLRLELSLLKNANILLGTAMLLVIAISSLLKVSWNIEDCLYIAKIIAVPLALGLVLTFFGKLPAVAGVLTISSLMLSLAMIGAALALLGARSPIPIADSWLAAADNQFPISAMDIVIGTSQLPPWAILALVKVYLQAIPCFILSLVLLLLMDRGPLAWRMFLIWGWSLLVVALIAFTAPALGCFSQLNAQQVAHLPVGAGRYAMQSFQEFRNAAEPVLSLGKPAGVITFPSFHTVCALLLAQAWHGTRILGPLTKIITGIVIFSCVPIGGHYLIDLMAGAVVWWVITLAVDRFSKVQVIEIPRLEIATSPA